MPAPVAGIHAAGLRKSPSWSTGPVIANEVKRSRAVGRPLDCFAALAMTPLIPRQAVDYAPSASSARPSCPAMRTS